MNLLGHIIANTPDEIIFQIFDITEQKLSEYQKMIAEILDVGCASRLAKARMNLGLPPDTK